MTAEPGATASSISLAHLLAVAGLDLSDVLLIRHPLGHDRVRDALEADQLRQYTSSQGARFPGRQRFWLVFLGEEGRSARYVACYENAGILAPGQFALSDASVLPDLVNRLVVHWGPGTRSWWQNGTTAVSKPVLAIMDRRVERFPGFENLVLNFRELERVVIEPRRYAEWHAAMSSVSAVYLIVDAHTGKHYVGSAYGVGGLARPLEGVRGHLSRPQREHDGRCACRSGDVRAFPVLGAADPPEELYRVRGCRRGDAVQTQAAEHGVRPQRELIPRQPGGDRLVRFRPSPWRTAWRRGPGHGRRRRAGSEVPHRRCCVRGVA